MIFFIWHPHLLHFLRSSLFGTDLLFCQTKQLVQSSPSSTSQRASFLAAEAPYSGDWLFTLPIASCGHKLEDEAVRVAVALRLALDVCVPHSCRCGALIDANGLHSFVCKRCPGRTVRHQALNDVVARAFTSANIPVTKEPNGLSRLDGKRPDGLTLIPWQSGKPLIMGRDRRQYACWLLCFRFWAFGWCSRSVGSHQEKW